MIDSDHVPRLSASAGSAERTRVVLISGMSGAGRSTALKLLEDMGYEAVDNLPLSLLPPLVDARGQQPRPIAVGIDIRTRDFGVSSLCEEVSRLVETQGLDCRLVFLECDDDLLERRFTETRRVHPLAGDRPVADGIRLERSLMAPVRQRADIVIDTSGLHRPELQRLLVGHFGLGDRPGLKLFVTSFAFREGLPREADLVFDVRFLENPFYRGDLRNLTGRDPEVGAFVASDPAWLPFFSALTQLLGTLLPSYAREGKSYLTIAMGCTGGRHRSVYAVERLAEWLHAHGHVVSAAHRDIERPVDPHVAFPNRKSRDRLQPEPLDAGSRPECGAAPASGGDVLVRARAGVPVRTFE